MNSRLWKHACCLVALCCVAGAASAASNATGDSVVLQWNTAALQAVRDTHPGPPICARMLAIVSTCMYDAWAAYDSLAVGTRLGDTLRRPAAERTQANKEKAISFAAYRALVDLFPQPAEVQKLSDMMGRLGYDPTDAEGGLFATSDGTFLSDSWGFEWFDPKSNAVPDADMKVTEIS